MDISGQEERGGGTSSLAAMSEAEVGALGSRQGGDEQVWTGPQTAKRSGQIDKGKVGPRVMWGPGPRAGLYLRDPRRMQDTL